MRGLCALASRALQAAFERTQRRTSSARLRTTSPGATVWEELTRTVVPARGHDSCNIRDVPTTSRTGGTLRSAPPLGQGRLIAGLAPTRSLATGAKQRNP